MLIQAYGEALRALTHQSNVDSAGYRAACRVAMRLVVILFAESRDLLPRDNALYHGSYGLNGLFDQLEREGGTLSNSSAAWPYILALFRLVRDGSHHPALPVHAYGGELFAAGDVTCSGRRLPGACRLRAGLLRGPNAVRSRGAGDVAAHSAHNDPHSPGSSRRPSGGARGFSDLSSEYLGILYEGLLDHELKTAPLNDPVVFLAAGDQPVLPLSRLQAMDSAALKALFESLKKTKPADQDEVSDEEVEEDEPDLDIPGADATDQESDSDSDARRRDRTRAETWARRGRAAGDSQNQRRDSQDCKGKKELFD